MITFYGSGVQGDNMGIAYNSKPIILGEKLLRVVCLFMVPTGIRAIGKKEDIFPHMVWASTCWIPCVPSAKQQRSIFFGSTCYFKIKCGAHAFK